MQAVSSDTVAGSSARRLIPALLVVPVVLGAIRLKGQAMGWYGTEFGVALLATGSALALVGLTVRNARVMTRLEAGRDALLERIERQRAALVAEQHYKHRPGIPYKHRPGNQRIAQSNFALGCSICQL